MDADERDRMWRDPTNWRWGLFYYNPDDPRVVVPKRFSKLGGWTFNGAHPGRAGLTFAGMLAVLFGPSFALWLVGVRDQRILVAVLLGSIVAMIGLSWRLSRSP